MRLFKCRVHLHVGSQMYVCEMWRWPHTSPHFWKLADNVVPDEIVLPNLLGGDTLNDKIPEASPPSRFDPR